MKTYFEKDVPLSVAMWDYSWLMCGHRGGAFHDLSRCVEEAADRGYNTLRVDVFPHYYFEPEHTFAAAGGDRRIRTWGDVLVADGYTVNVRERVIELAELCRRHGVWLGLDTWQSFQVLGHDRRVPPAEEESVCRGWADTWVQALRAMRQDGVLERAVWVAPLNEVPIFLGNMIQRVRDSVPAQVEVGDGQIKHLLPEHDAIYMELNRWLGEAVRDEIAGDGVPLLYSGVWVEDYIGRVPAFYDGVDAHFMPDAKLSPEDAEALEKAGEGASRFALHGKQDPWDFALFSAAWARAVRRNYRAMLENARAFCEKTFDTVRLEDGSLKFEVVCTEAYGPCSHPDHPEVDWAWYRHYNADAARVFADYPFSGLTLSNHAEPLFSLWQDRDWHARGNAYLLGSA
ncbi:MAG: cellulase-like family protein [Planctomycetota bacterium]